MGKLTALAVKNAKVGRHGDGAGLYLLVSATGAKSWMLRVQHDGVRRDIGLGSLDGLTLAEARDRARDIRSHAVNGRDPIAERDRERGKAKTFREATVATHAALKDGWVEKNAAAFLTSLETYAYPVLGDLHVASITAGNIHEMLAPIWIAKPELARKVRIRVGQVLNFSHSKGWRATEAPSRSITVALPKQPKGDHFKAMPYEEVPAFYADLRSKTPTKGRRALMLVILTAARPGEVRRGCWYQIDHGKRDWNRPAAIMKERIAHTVTLNTPALALLDEIKAERRVKRDDLFFPNRNGDPISDMTMNKVLRDAGVKWDVHGFRSTFRDWVAEQMPDVPDAIAEAAISHQVPDKVMRAYKRTDFLERRRKLLEAWGAFVTNDPSTEPVDTDNL